MSLAEEYLNNLTEDIPVHSHTVNDSDSLFVIDPDTRKISYTGDTENVLVQYDHNSEVYTFELPRYVDGHDMTLCNRVYVHYNNVDGKTKRAIPNVAEMTDLRVSESDPTKVVSSWTISRNATQFAGTLNFLIQYMCVEDDTVVYEWHTDIYDGVYVNAGRKNNKQAVAKYTDVLEEWYQKLFGTGESVIALTEEKIEALIEEANTQINLAKEEIVSKANETLDSIPSEYTELHNYANEAARTKGDAVTHVVKGEVISVSDSSDDYLRGLRVFGKTTQVKTTGKNLLDVTLIKDSAYVQNVDGTIKVSAPSTASSVSAGCKLGELVPSLIIGNSYILTFDTTGSSHYIYLAYGANLMWTSGNEKVITQEMLDSEVMLYASGVSTSATISNLMVRSASITDDTYEPYSGGVVSPSPEWPQELTSIENPVVDVYGKNLLKHTVSPGSHTIKGITFTVRDDGSVVCNGTATAPATLSFERCYLTEDIIVSGCPAGGDTQTYRITVDTYKNDSYIRSEFDLGNSVTIRKASYDYVNINIFFYAGTVADNMVFYPMVRHASITDATYEPYNGGSARIPHTLSGIPVSQNGNYTDENGQQWICDEVDFERGVYAQRVGQITLTNDRVYYYNTDTAGKEFFYTHEDNNVAAWETRMYSSHFPVIGGNVSMSSNYWTQFSGSGGVRFRHKDLTSLADLAAWLVENPVSVCYVLATPIETPLTTTELQTFKYLHSNYPNTTVVNDSGAMMELKYNVDTELFIKNTVPRPTDEQVNDIVMPWLEDNSELLRGPQGPQGPQGIQGEIGPQGPKGADGTMVFSDLTEEQKETLRGPQGVQGEQGPKGDTGETGPQGPKGDTGKTAYEYAKDGGYAGSETDFAAKLTTEYLPLSGGDMTDGINMNGHQLMGLNDPDADDEAANAGYVKQQIKDRVIYGKGKNLLKNTAKSQTRNGVTFTVNEDGSITVNGTATNTTIFVIGYISVKAGTDYICNSGTDLLRYSFRLEDGNTVVHDFSTNNAYTPDSDNRYTVCIRVGNGNTVNETSYPMIRLASETDATYEPYYEGLKELTDRAEKLLWENASVESEFGTDSPITLPYTVKKGTMVCMIQTESNAYVSMLIIDGKPCRIFYTTGNLDANWYRTFTLNGNQITVGTGRRQGVADNTVIVPFQFYGYKEVS